MSLDKLRHLVGDHAMLSTHPHWEDLVEIICGETGVSSAGFPYISDTSFTSFVNRVPHLFRDGQAILEWLSRFDDYRETLDGLTFEETDSMTRGIKVIRTMIFTAAVTCLSDLWLIKQVLMVHRNVGIIKELLAGESIHPSSYSHLHDLDERQLSIDLHFLHSRGYLKKMDTFFVVPDNEKIGRALDIISNERSVSTLMPIDRMVSWLEGKADDEVEAYVESCLSFEVPVLDMGSWIADPEQVEMGFRLVPILLALRVMKATFALKVGTEVRNHVSCDHTMFERLMERGGWVHYGRVTELGARVFERAPGPVGIIHAYWPYLEQLDDRLMRKDKRISVRRAANVAASQDANRKTFTAANDALDRFCEQYGFRYTVFIEHAVGQGEATRQRFERSGASRMQYFGADLEDAAIDQAIKQQELGVLPANMAFIRNADIGEPDRVIGYLRENELDEEPAVMMVGNGFHEIRNQSNEKMIDVFSEYQNAGFVLIFTEESALSDEDLISTGWNTYHAGFRYVHEMSGQGLRPIWDSGESDERWGWRHCAEEGGYIILDEFSYRSRKIYPFPRPDRDNPSISMNYFCVPSLLAARLDIFG